MLKCANLFNFLDLKTVTTTLIQFHARAEKHTFFVCLSVEIIVKKIFHVHLIVKLTKLV